MAKNTIEAYGVKGMKSTAWRKQFKDATALTKWVEENGAEVYGHRELDVPPPSSSRDADRIDGYDRDDLGESPDY